MGQHEDALEEIYLERARYLLNADEIQEEMLIKAQETVREHPVLQNRELKFGSMARTVCCGTLVYTDKATLARIKTGEQFLVCNDDCRKLIEMATLEQLDEIATMKPK